MNREPLRFGRYDFAAFSAFTMYSICSLAIPLMIVAMGNSLNFPLESGGMGAGGGLQVVRSVFMVISLFLCFSISGWFGRRITLGASVLLIGFGIFCCGLTTQYRMLFPCLVAAGFGEGICEGLLTPFVQDLHSDSPERYVNIGHSFWSVGIAIAVLLIGGLITLGAGWRILLCGIGFLTALSSLFFLWKENPGREYPENRGKTDFGEIRKQTLAIMKEKRFWLCCLAMFFCAGAEFGLTFWAAAYIELSFRTTTFVAGLGTGMIALGMFIGRFGFGYFARPERLRYILLSTGLGTIPVTLLLAFLEPGMMPPKILFLLVFLLLFLAGFGVASYWPNTQLYGVIHLPHCNSALLYIFYSAFGIPGCGFFSWLMGWVGDHFGLKGTILVVPVCLCAFSAIIYYECWIRAKKKPVSA